MMLCLHLFNTDYKGLFSPLLFIGTQPLSYYISLFSDACVPIFAFISGYGLYYSYLNNQHDYSNKNKDRTKKLYVRYWIILILFAVLLGWVLNKEGYPGSWEKFVLNFTGLNPSYNGAWWFFTIYVLFVFTSSFWFTLLSKLNAYFYLFILLLVYLSAFYFRVYKANLFENTLLLWGYTQGVLYFCTLFQFMLGAFALKHHWHRQVTNLFSKIKYPNVVAILGIIVLIGVHGLVPSFIVSPFTALGFIFLFLQIKFGNLIERCLDFFTPHATNMWLVHMFFYMIYFKEFVYSFNYVLPIFIVLVGLSVDSSYIINFLNKKVQQLL